MNDITVTLEWTRIVNSLSVTYHVNAVPERSIEFNELSMTAQLTLRYNIRYNVSISASVRCGRTTTASISLFYSELIMFNQGCMQDASLYGPSYN